MIPIYFLNRDAQWEQLQLCPHNMVNKIWQQYQTILLTCSWNLFGSPYLEIHCDNVCALCKSNGYFQSIHFYSSTYCRIVTILTFFLLFFFNQTDQPIVNKVVAIGKRDKRKELWARSSGRCYIQGHYERGHYTDSQVIYCKRENYMNQREEFWAWRPLYPPSITIKVRLNGLLDPKWLKWCCLVGRL